MNKSTLLLIGAGVAIGYLFANKIVTLNAGNNPFALTYNQGVGFAS